MHILRSNLALPNQEPNYAYIATQSENFDIFTEQDLDEDAVNAIQNLGAIYGYIDFTEIDGEGLTIRVAGNAFAVSDVYDGDKFDNFDTLGLCQGILQIYDEEQEAIIANAVWNNGTLYVPVYTDDGGLKTCVRNLQAVDEFSLKPLSQMIAESERCFYGSVDGITYDDLTDVLSGSGLTLATMEIQEVAVTSVKLPGLRLACDTTQLWLNG